MASRSYIENLAAKYIAQTDVFATSDDKEIARLMSYVYEETRDFVLSQYGWSFARKQVELAEDLGNPSINKWTNSYALPIDFLRLETLNDDQNLSRYSPEFEIMGSNLFTNQESARIVYIRGGGFEGDFPPYFTIALASRLAAETAFSKTQQMSLYDAMQIKAENALREAKKADQRNRNLSKSSYQNYPTANARRFRNSSLVPPYSSFNTP